MSCLVSIITSIIVWVVFFPVVVNTFGGSPLVVLVVLLVIGGLLVGISKDILSLFKGIEKGDKDD